MFQFSCCGMQGPSDYVNSKFTNLSFAKQIKINNTSIIRPLTCCKLKDDVRTVQAFACRMIVVGEASCNVCTFLLRIV